MSKHRLILDDGYEFLAYGLSCHLKDYRVAALLNEYINQHFIRSTVELPVKNNQFQPFSRYTALDQDARIKYMLLSNHNEDIFLFPPLKEYDFFLMVEGYIDLFDDSSFIQRIQSIPPIQFVSPLDKDYFEKIQYALFEE